MRTWFSLALLSFMESSRTGKRGRSAASSPPPRKRRLVPLNLASIRSANPELDDEQGPRAHLKPLGSLVSLLENWQKDAAALRALDAVVDALCGVVDSRNSSWERKSRLKVVPCDLQLFTLDCSTDMLAAACYAGFFCFASEFAYPGRPLEQRGLLNLELAGPEVDRQEGDPGGRLILDLSSGSTDRLILGKRSIKSVQRAGGGSASDGGGGTPYRLTVCAAFERSWAAIVACHGIDWCGFDNVRCAYHALHSRAPWSWEDGAGTPSVAVGAEGGGPPSVISIELWDASSEDELVSAEVGVLVGQCYTCLSLFARVDKYPRSDWVRAQAATLWLRRAGVELFDAGTTAGYYANLFGFRRCASRRAFAAEWRAHRDTPLTTPLALRDACQDVRGLLEAYRDEVNPSIARQERPAHGAAHKSRRPQKHTVRFSGLPTGVSDSAIRAALERAPPPASTCTNAITKIATVEHLGLVFVTFGDEAAAAAALSLDGCAMPIFEGDPAPIVAAQLHGRKTKRGDSEPVPAVRTRASAPAAIVETSSVAAPTRTPGAAPSARPVPVAVLRARARDSTRVALELKFVV